MKKFHVLLVEDEPRIASTLAKYLALESYQYTVLSSGENVIDTVRNQQIDICILDIMLPEKDGISLCKEIRSFSNIPIIFLTAKVEEIDRLIGFDAGADDYVCKPFSPKELMARIGVWLNRKQVAAKHNKQLTFNGLVLDIELFQVTVEQQPIKLTVNEFNILQRLLEHPEKVFSRKELLLAAKQRDIEIYERTIDSHIKNLRKKLSSISGNGYINAIYGVGYTLKAVAQ
ncbi:response regulator [Colwellia sp. MEBiC06753]